MKVVVVAEQLRRRVPAGIGTYTRGLLAGLRALSSAPDSLEALEVTVHASRAPRRPDPLAVYGFPTQASFLPAPVLTRAWDRGWVPAPRADVVHATSLALPPVRHGAAAVTIHDLLWRELPETFPPRGRRWHEAAYRRALEQCQLVVVPAADVAAAVAADAPEGLRVEVVAEGCDHLAPPDDAAAATLLGTLGVTDPFLFTVSTLEPRKNLQRLVRAFQVARTRLDEPIRLVIAGVHGWGNESPPAGAGVAMAGGVSDDVLSALLRRAVAVVYVPRREGFGLPAVEAMAAGAPVVASPMPSTGGAALEVDPEDEDAIADALVRVVTDDGLRGELVAAGTARAGELTWEAAARRHVELWRTLG